MTKKTSTPTKPPGRNGTPAWAAMTVRTATARSPWMSPRSSLAIAPVVHVPGVSKVSTDGPAARSRCASVGASPRDDVPDRGDGRDRPAGQGAGLPVRPPRARRRDRLPGRRAGRRDRRRDLRPGWPASTGAGAVTGAANAEACARRRRGAARGAVGRPRRAGRLAAAGRQDRRLLRQPAGLRQARRARPGHRRRRGLGGRAGPGLAPEATVVGAFHNVSAVRLVGATSDYLDEDVLCVGDSDDGKAVAMELAARRHRPRGHQRRQAAAGPPARAAHRRC